MVEGVGFWGGGGVGSTAEGEGEERGWGVVGEEEAGIEKRRGAEGQGRVEVEEGEADEGKGEGEGHFGCWIVVVEHQGRRRRERG